MMEKWRKRLMEDANYEPEPVVKSFYGPIPGIEPGTTFDTRQECAASGVHAVINAGIHGSKDTGAYSVCLSGGYEDDKDEGNFFLYTGTGGQEDSYSGSHRQIGDQSFDHPHNASLLVSMELKQDVRVIRGSKLKSPWAPAEGYRYDGVYLVERAYYEKGISGYRVCRFEFRLKSPKRD